MPQVSLSIYTPWKHKTRGSQILRVQNKVSGMTSYDFGMVIWRY